VNAAQPITVDFTLKAIAPQPACLFVAELTPRNRQDILVYAMKDLANAGIAAQLVLGGPVTGAYDQYLSRLSALTGTGIQVVRNPDPFTLSRMFRYCQYFLVPPGADEASGSTVEALRHGCIPIAGRRTYARFFDDVERVVRTTFGNPEAFAEMHATVLRRTA
jgi:glycogen synthase